MSTGVLSVAMDSSYVVTRGRAVAPRPTQARRNGKAKRALTLPLGLV